MLASVLAVVAVLALLGLAANIAQPILLLVVLAFALLPLMIMGAGRLFKHVSAPVNSGASGGPAVPTSREASYEPVSDPSDRG